MRDVKRQSLFKVNNADLLNALKWLNTICSIHGANNQNSHF